MSKWMCLLCVVFSAVASAQPAINTNGIVNAASYALVGLPNASIAQGSIFAIFGTKMGPASSPTLTWPLQRSLGGVSVQIQDASGAAQQAILLYVSPTQINAILPSATAVGAATATVSYGGQTSAPASFTVAKSSFGTFSLNTEGNGQGVVLNYVQNQAWPTNTVVTSAKPGQPVVLWGTGLGPVSGDETQPPVQGDLRSGLDPMQLWVGGQQVPIAYAGRSTSAGQDQINFVAPNIPGCYVPVTLQIGNVVSNTVQIAISPSGGVCQDSSMPNLDASKVLANGLKAGSLDLWQETVYVAGGASPQGTTQGVTAQFAANDWVSLLYNQGPGVDIYGACTVYAFAQATGLPFLGTATPLNAGSPMTVTGPGGATTTLIQPKLIPVGDYTYGLPNGPISGAYTMKNGSGGSDVGSFTASLNVPAPFTWSGLTGITQVDRSQGFTLDWTGGSGNVFITGLSYALVNRTLVGAQFTCLAKASDTMFTVPPYVLMALPASVTVNTQVQGFLYVDNQAATASFSANGLDVGTFSADYEYLATTTFN